MDTYMKPEPFDLKLKFQTRQILIGNDVATFHLEKLTNDGLYLETTYIQNEIIFRHIEVNFGIPSVVYEYTQDIRELQNVVPITSTGNKQRTPDSKEREPKILPEDEESLDCNAVSIEADMRSTKMEEEMNNNNFRTIL